MTCTDEEREKAVADILVNRGIVETILPQLYVVVDDLLDHVKPDCPREIIMRAKKLLPNWATNSMEQSPPAGKTKPESDPRQGELFPKH